MRLASSFHVALLAGFALVTAAPVLIAGPSIAETADKTTAKTDAAKPGDAKLDAKADTKASDTKASDIKASDTKASDTKTADTASDKKKPTRAQLEAMLSKCSDEADAKGLSVAKGKGAARKAFRRECMHKMGVDPR